MGTDSKGTGIKLWSRQRCFLWVIYKVHFKGEVSQLWRRIGASKDMKRLRKVERVTAKLQTVQGVEGWQA